MNPGIERVASLMDGFVGRWGIAGGWAIDLYLGHESRPHADLDVAIMRDDQLDLRSRLAFAERKKAIDHTLVDWADDETLVLPVHEVHVTWPDGFHAEFLLNEQDRERQEWVFRRDDRIRRSLAGTFAIRLGVPYLSPEIVLLYKSKGTAAKDDADFANVLPLLSDESRAWLANALRVTSPAHPWTTRLIEEA